MLKGPSMSYVSIYFNLYTMIWILIFGVLMFSKLDWISLVAFDVLIVLSKACQAVDLITNIVLHEYK